MNKEWISHLLDGIADMAADMAAAADRGDESVLLHLMDGLKMAVSDLEEAIGEIEEDQ
ncbi:MAG: hypothetical protein QXI12_06335 [Candidatus Methanomethyliaceae archaeon]